MWLLRLGLYELLREKEQAHDWIWLVDHTVQVGKGKCFVVVAIRAESLQKKRLDPFSCGALTCQDLTVWKIELVDNSCGLVVEQQLEKLCEKTGQVPRAILSDRGADLISGIATFCERHPQTIAIEDLPHFAANAIKKELTNDPDWPVFLVATNRSKTSLRQTKLAFLLPPDLRAKARWMNLGPLIAWSQKVLLFLDSPIAVKGVSLTEEELKGKMGWLQGYRNSLRKWSEILQVVESSLEYIRKTGYHRNCRKELSENLSLLAMSAESAARRVADRILDYVEQQSVQLREGEHLLATTEVLESLLGKAKKLHGQQSRSGFTKMVLGIAASVSELTTDVVTTALSAIKVHHVTEWIKSDIGTSVQAQRNQALKPRRIGTKTG